MSLSAEGAIPFNAEEFSDPSELRALTELIGEKGMEAVAETGGNLDDDYQANLHCTSDINYYCIVILTAEVNIHRIIYRYIYRSFFSLNWSLL